MISPYYINLQGKFGNRLEEYLNLGDLLSHMDRLGIWQTTATCLRTNVRESNRGLLEQLEATPGAKERVIPAFLAEEGAVVTDTQFGEAVTISFSLPEEGKGHLEATLIDRSNGRLSAVFTGEEFAAFPVERHKNS